VLLRFIVQIYNTTIKKIIFALIVKMDMLLIPKMKLNAFLKVNAQIYSIM